MGRSPMSLGSGRFLSFGMRIVLLVFLLAGSLQATAATVSPPAAAPRAEARRQVGWTTAAHPNIFPGGRAVAADISSGDANVALVASESGGLFQTRDGGTTWTHVDSLQPFRLIDVAFAPSNPRVVIVTAWDDNRVFPGGGLWRSSDGGFTWNRATGWIGAGPTCPQQTVAMDPAMRTSIMRLDQSAFGIAFAPDSPNVYVGAACGIARSTDLGASWTPVAPAGIGPNPYIRAVTAHPGGIVDACGDAGHYRSTDGGATFGAVTAGSPGCLWARGLAAYPLDSGVVLAVSNVTPPSSCRASGRALASAVFEGDYSGGVVSWQQISPSICKSGRHPFVTARRSADGDPTHVDVYFGSGEWVYKQVCRGVSPGAARCSNAATAWVAIPNASVVPNASIPHEDISDIAYSAADNCPRLMTSDGGVHRSTDCGATWPYAGSGRGGYNALQLYEVAGQILPGHLDLYVGTQDNQLWASADGGRTWPRRTNLEGGIIEAPRRGAGDAGQLVTFVDFGNGTNMQSAAHFGTPGSPRPWNNPPGGGGNPYLISPGVYIQWTGSPNGALTLNLTANAGGRWTPILFTNGTLSGGPQIAGPATNPTIFQALQRPNGTVGLWTITGLPLDPSVPPGPVRIAEVENGGALNIGRWCFGEGTFLCPIPVFGVDPDDPRRIIVADVATGSMLVSSVGSDGRLSWSPDAALTTAITGGGQFLFSMARAAPQVGIPGVGVQAHAIAFSPTTPKQIFIGTESAGIFVSRDNGRSWTMINGSNQIPAVTSFFFRDRTIDGINCAWASSYGRGLWTVCAPPDLPPPGVTPPFIPGVDFDPYTVLEVRAPNTSGIISFRQFNDPDFCEICLIAVVPGGTIRDLYLSSENTVKGIAVAGGQLRTVDVEGKEVFQELYLAEPVPPETVGTFEGCPACGKILSEGGAILGVVTDDAGTLLGIIAGFPGEPAGEQPAQTVDAPAAETLGVPSGPDPALEAHLALFEQTVEAPTVSLADLGFGGMPYLQLEGTIPLTGLNAAYPGDVATLFGSGFCADPGCQPVSIWVGERLAIEDAKAQADGAFVATLPVAEGPGAYVVTARQSDAAGVERSALATLTVPVGEASTAGGDDEFVGTAPVIVEPPAAPPVEPIPAPEAITPVATEVVVAPEPIAPIPTAAPPVATGAASLEIHRALCPPGYAGPDYYAVCHDGGAPGIPFALDSFDGAHAEGVTQIEASPGPGVLRFADLAEGGYSLSELDAVPGELVYIFCSPDRGQTVLAEATGTAPLAIDLKLTGGTAVVCDWYTAPAAG